MRYIKLLLLLTLTLNINAQRPTGAGPKPVVKGTVVDAETNEALEFATIAIYNSADKSLLDGGITDAEGKFSIGVKARSINVEIEYLGFEKKVFENLTFEKGKPVIDLGSIEMSAGGIALDEVEVTAERSELQFALDKRVFNVGKDLSSSGGSAQEILDNIPSVSVGVEGEVELRGSSNVRILVNGRPSGLLGLGDNNGLRNIQSNMIERIEIVTNPSSKYEAEGMAGIINIVLKKEKAKGFNGSFELSGGEPTTYGVGANINYRQDNLNWFINANANRRTSPGGGTNYQEFYTANGTNVSLNERRFGRDAVGYSIRGGSDYYISDKEVITASFLYKHSKDDNNNYVIYRDSFFENTPTRRLTEDDFDYYTYRSDNEQELDPTIEFALNYDKKFSGKGHNLKASFSYQDNVETESSDISENIYFNDKVFQEDVFLQRSSNEEGQNSWRTQLDYTRPFDNKGKLELGALGNFRNIDNDFQVESFIDGAYVIDPNYTNNFVYRENIAAAYANYGREYQKFSYQVGLRGETSFISTELKTTNEVNDRTYTNLFPSAFAGYKLSETNSIQASYSRRIRRPRFFDLNPFFSLTDNRNFFSGNPNLDPEYTDSYEISHLKYWEKGNIGTSIYYRNTTDRITRILTRVDGSDNETVRRPENIGTEQNYGLEFVWGYNGIKNLRLDGSLNGYRFDINGQAENGSALTAQAYTWDAKLNTRLTFWKKANVQMRLNYRAPRKSIQGERKSVTSINLAASKDFLNDNLTVTLSIRDLLNNRRRQSTVESPTYFGESDFQWRPRTFSATINYRINMKKSRRPQRSYDGGGGEGEF